MPAAATHLVISQPPGGVTAGMPFGLTLEAEDQFGNVDTNFNGSVAVALGNGSTGSLSGTTSMMASQASPPSPTWSIRASGPISLNVTGGTLTGTSTGTVTVSSAQAAKLVVQVQPSQSATAGVPFSTQPVVYEEDQYGNLLTGDNTTQVTVYLGSGAGALEGTLSATVSGGIARFTGLADQTAGTISLLFTGGGLTSIPSVPITISPAAASKLVIQTEPSAAATAGLPFAIQPVLAIEDGFGNVETNDSSTQVTASLATGAGPLLGTTTVTVKGGVATFTSLTDDKAETISLDFADGSLTAGPSTGIAITVAASKLVIHAEPSATATAGQPFSIQPVIYEEDVFGNLITSDNTTMVTASIASGAGPLQGTTSVTMSGGIATFTNLADDTAETITLAFSGGGLTAGPAPSISVAAAAPSKLVIHTQPTETATAGAVFATQPVVVYEEDRFGNLETGDSNTLITAALATGTGPLHGTTVVPLSGGIATFSDLIDNLAESIALDFSGGGLTSSSSVPVTVNPAAASKLLITTPPSATAVVGQPFATQPDITEEDQFGNVETTDNSTLVTASLVSGSGPLQGTTSVTLSDGVAHFTDLADDTFGTIALGFSGGGLTTPSPAIIAVSDGPPSKLVIKTEASTTATAGQAFSTQPVIVEEDQFGDIETTDSTTVVTVSLASGARPVARNANRHIEQGRGDLHQPRRRPGRVDLPQVHRGRPHFTCHLADRDRSRGRQQTGPSH